MSNYYANLVRDLTKALDIQAENVNNLKATELSLQKRIAELEKEQTEREKNDQFVEVARALSHSMSLREKYPDTNIKVIVNGKVTTDICCGSRVSVTVRL